jgi:outer membrane receptor protein involved in Fe transport
MLVTILCAWPAGAQEQRGVIEGTVRDATGAILPGATVEATAQNGAVLNTVSDDAGVYRFPSVAPGNYTLRASLSGFQSRSVENVQVGLGQIKAIDFALPLAGVTETVEVTAISPLVDVRQATRQTNIRSEQVELLPKGRDFTSLVTQAPGANNEPRLGGISIDGASAGENRYIIDGMETTDLQTGTSGMNLIADFVEEVQVRSSGYTAEYGGATGGVINVLTKSGTNNFGGTAGFQFQGSTLSGARRPSLRINLTDANAAEYVTYPEDEETRMEPSFSLGGPIVRNRVWYFGAYQPALTTTQRVVNPTTAVNPSAGTFDREQRRNIQYATGNITAQMSNDLRGRFAFNNSWSRTRGLLPSLQGTDLSTTNYAINSTFPTWTASGNLDWIASPAMFVGLRAGYYLSDHRDEGVEQIPRVIFSTGNNLNFPEVPADLRRSTGFQNIPTNFEVLENKYTRAYVQADTTYYGQFAGRHQLKAGISLDRLGNDVDEGETRNLIRLRWNTSLSGVRGTYGYYQVRSNGVDPKRGFVTEGSINSTIVGLFVQDQWTVNDRLTLNVGVRTERERVPYYTSGPGIPDHAIDFGFGDKIAPRLGAAYDVLGDGRWKAFASWGVFYDIFKLELPRGSFGGDKWLEYYYTLDTFDWRTLANQVAALPNCPPACPGTLIRGPIDFRHVSVPPGDIDPELDPMRMQEATAGLEHQLNDRIALSVRYVHKQLDRAVEDAGALDAQNNEIYTISNPGFGAVSIAHPGVAYPKAVRDYDSVELAAEKRLADNWFLRASYLWSRLFGNYSGLSQSDENGRTSPNVGRVFDYPLMMFQDGGVPAYGPLPTDRPHQFKTQFIYQFGFGTSVGVNQYVASGLPITRELGVYPPNNLPVQYLGRGSDGRTPVYSQTDLLVQHDLRLGDRSVQVFLNVLNLFNQETVTGVYQTYQYVNGVVPDEDLFYAGRQRLADLITSQNVVRDPRFLMANAYQAPVQARVGFRFRF